MLRILPRLPDGLGPIALITPVTPISYPQQPALFSPLSLMASTLPGYIATETEPPDHISPFLNPG